jgi:hypothetical protein
LLKKKSAEEESYELLTDDDSMIPQKLSIATPGNGESHDDLLPHFQKNCTLSSTTLEHKHFIVMLIRRCCF